MKTVKFSKSTPLWAEPLIFIYEEVQYLFKWGNKCPAGIKCLILKAFSSAVRTNERISDSVIKDLKRKTSIQSEKVNNSTIPECISGVVYKVKIQTKTGGVTLSSSTRVYVENKGKIVNISQPGRSINCREFLKILRPGFKLITTSDGSRMLEVLSAIYSVSSRLCLKNQSCLEKDGNFWFFKIETAVGRYSCFIIKTNPSGKVIKIIYKSRLLPFT